MKDIELLEAAKGGPFRFRHDGETYTVADPADVDFQVVLAALQVEHVPGAPNMAEWKRALLFRLWSAHHDLPVFLDANRLAYLVDHYRSALVYDLQLLGVDLGELWRARRWRTLLDLIDHLPGHSWFNASVANDDEHAMMIAEAMAARKAEGEDVADAGPPLQTWTPELAKLTEISDGLAQVRHTIIAVNSERGKAPKAPELSPRPRTLLDTALKQIQFEKRQAKHDALAKRMLPHKR